MYDKTNNLKDMIMKTKILPISVLFLFVLNSCDNASDSRNTVHHSRMTKNGGYLVEYNSEGVPIKKIYEWTFGDTTEKSYEDFIFNSDGLRTGSKYYYYDNSTGIFNNTFYSTIEHDEYGYEIKHNWYLTADDSLDSYNKITYLNNKIKNYDRFYASGAIRDKRIYDNLGRVIQISDLEIYWDYIFAFGGRTHDDSGILLDPPPPSFTLKFTYFNNTNLPLAVEFIDQSSSSYYMLIYVVLNGVYQSAELRDENDILISKVTFGQPESTNFGFTQTARADLITTPSNDLIHRTFYSSYFESEFRISSDQLFLGITSWPCEYETGKINNKCIPATFER